MPNALKATLELFWNMCLLRGGPERVPTASLFVALVVAANLTVAVSTLLVNPIPGLTPIAALSWVVVPLALLASGIWLVLWLSNVSSRFLATLTAVLGCDATIGALLLPLIGLGAGTEDTGFGWLLDAIILAAFIWSLVVAGFILHRAMEVSPVRGTALAFLLWVTSYIFAGALLPPPTA